MRTAIVYYSMSGNTKYVADVTVQAGLCSKCTDLPELLHI